VCAAASGGEVFVSDVTRQLAGTMPDVAFADRGEYDLKGFPHPWKLWSLSWRSALPDAGHEVFVGRDAELAELRKHLHAALDGHGSLVLVGGEPGVGKTTLVKRLIKEAEQRGAVALFGRCYESEGTVPYSPFVETTEQALRVVPPEWVREDLGDAAPEVARMVPELHRRFPDIGDPVDLPPEQQRRYFFNAISDFIGRASDRMPIVLVADDIHWADEPTLLLIEHVAAQLSELRILAIGTYRDVELDVSRPLAATLERLLRARLAERIAVKRFDRSGVGRLLDAHAGRPAPVALVEAIFSETEGNPFFVDEVFRHLVEEGRVFDDRGEFRPGVEIDELDVPESVRLVVGRRIERLGAEAQRVLAAGAVVGRGFEFGLLERITDADPATVLDVIDEAERARVIVPEERGNQVFYTFGHELIRQTLLTSLSFPRRQKLHLAVADAMELVDPVVAETRPSEVAYHLLQAGAAADPVRTVRYLALAADRSLGAAAFEEALRYVEGALELVAPDDERTKAELLERLGWVERAMGRFDRCIEIWDGVVDSYTRLGEVEAAGRLLWEVGYQFIWLGRFESAAAAYARGLGIVGEEPSATRALLIGALATLVGFAGSHEAAQAQFDEALDIAEPLGDDRLLGRVLWGRCVTNWSHLRPEEAVADGRRAIEHLRRANDLWTLVDALGWTALPLALSGHRDAAEAVAREAVELGIKLGHQGGEIVGARGVWIADTLVGLSLDDSIRRGEEDLRRMKEVNAPWVSQSHAWLSAAHTLQGALDHGLREADEAIAIEPASAWSGAGWAFRFHNRMHAGDAPECRAMLDDAYPTLTRQVDTVSAGSGLMLLSAAEGCAVFGWTDELAELYPLVAVVAKRMPVRVFDHTTTERIAGMAAAALGRWDDADAHFSTALRQSESIPNRADDAAVRHRYADMLLRRGRPEDRDRALALLRDAVEGYERIGTPILLAEAQRLLASSEPAP
jgi:tetratricopeptide (TPR) repeat protein